MTTAASVALASGTMRPLKPLARASMAMGSTPFTGSTVPSSDNSPIIIYLSRRSVCIDSLPTRSATAMGRS